MQRTPKRLSEPAVRSVTVVNITPSALPGVDYSEYNINLTS